MSCGTCGEMTKAGVASATPLKGVLGIGAPVATGAAVSIRRRPTEVETVSGRRTPG